MGGSDRLDIAGLIGAELKLRDGTNLLIRSEIGDGLLEVIELPSGRLHRLEDPLTGDMSLCDAGWIERLSADGDLNVVRRRDAPPRRAARAVRTYTREEILAKDPYAEARLLLARALRGRGVWAHHPDLGRHARECWAEQRLEQRFGIVPTTRRVRDWLGRADLETVSLRDMMSESGRVRRTTPLDPALDAIYRRHANDYWYERGRGWTVMDAAGEAAVEKRKVNEERVLTGEPLLPDVNRETMRRRINELLCRDAYAAKWGEPAARRKFDGGGYGISADRILQTVVMDDTVVDCITVVHEGVAGRAYLCSMLDVHSRGIPGAVVSMTPPSQHTAALCLRRANRAKVIRADRLARHPALARMGGKPNRIIVDNGKNYASPAFVETCADLGITVEIAPVEMPRAKAMKERFYYTFKQYLISKLPGATLDPSALRKLGIDPTTEAVITLETLQTLLDEFLFYYHTRVHSSIDARPVDKWMTSMAAGHRHVLDSEEKLDELFGVVVHGRRLTANGGVRIFGGLTYKAPDMGTRIVDRLAGREPHATRVDATTACTVKIRYDPADLGSISVEVGREWVRLQCTDPDYASGLSLWQHQQIRAFARRGRMKFESEEDKLVARAELNAAIIKEFPDLPMQTRRAASRFIVGEAPSAVHHVEHVVAEPRHDGMGPVVEHQAAFTYREDLHRAPDRPSGREDPDVDAAAAEDGSGAHGDEPHEGREDGVGHDHGSQGAASNLIGPDEELLGRRALWETPADDDERFEDFA